MIPTPESILEKHLPNVNLLNDYYRSGIIAAMREYYSTHQGYTIDDIKNALSIKGLYLHERQVNEVLAYLESVERVSPWQPIETAPKDRTKVDLWFVDGKKSKRITDCEFLHGKWWYGTVDLITFGYPTHWMLAPEKPKSWP